MAIAKVSSVGVVGANTTSASPITTTGATLLVAITANDASGAGTLSDSNGNTWHGLTEWHDTTNGVHYLKIWYSYDHGGSALSVGSGHYVTDSTGNHQSICFLAFSGTDATSAVYVSGTDKGNFTTPATTVKPGSVTPNASGDLLITACGSGIGQNSTIDYWSVDNGITKQDFCYDGTNMDFMDGWLVTTSGSAIDLTWTSSSDDYLVAVVAIFKQAGGAVAPTVTTTTPNHVGSVDALSGGNVTSDGGATITARGICWSTSANPTTADSHTTESGTTGSFTSQATGLSPNTGYHVRAYATNTTGTGYGADDQITTTRYRVIPTATMDSMLGVLSAATRLFVCSTQPTTYAEASTTYNLATQTLTSGDFSLAAGDTSGRKVTLAQKTGISVSTGGTALHYALGVSASSTLLVVGTTTSQALTQGGTFTFPATDIDEIRDWS
jgi:hypothetical protein